MIFKTLEDIERVIAAGKPTAVINAFVESYLTGKFMAPIVDAEQEYRLLESQESLPDVADTLDNDTGEILAFGYSPDAIRDERILELETLYPHLLDPLDGTSLADRRPNVEIDPLEAAPLKSGAGKGRARVRITEEVGDDKDLLADISKRLAMLERLAIRVLTPVMRGEVIPQPIIDAYLPLCEGLIAAVDSGQYIDRTDLEEPGSLFNKLLGRADHIGRIVQSEMKV